MSHLRRTLFIGLGGMGIQTILKTKAAVMDNYSIDGEMPPMIAFLGIDTDSNEYERTFHSRKGGDIKLEARERMDMFVRNPKAYYEYNRKEMGWMPHQNLIFLNSLYYGAVHRSNGRLAFIYNCLRIKGKFRQLLTDLHMLGGDVYGELQVDVHFVFFALRGNRKRYFY